MSDRRDSKLVGKLSEKSAGFEPLYTLISDWGKKLRQQTSGDRNQEDMLSMLFVYVCVCSGGGGGGGGYNN